MKLHDAGAGKPSAPPSEQEQRPGWPPGNPSTADDLHPLARRARLLVGHPLGEVRQVLEEAAGGDLDAVEAARRDLLRWRGDHPDDVAGHFALRHLHALRDEIADRAREAAP